MLKITFSSAVGRLNLLSINSAQHFRHFSFFGQVCYNKFNYFDVFDLPVKYDIPVDQLTPKYRNLLKKFHPDRFHQKSVDEKEESERQSRLINQAYRVLMHPVERGLHLLELKNSPQEESQLDINDDTLVDVYEINDELSETTDINRTEVLKQENDQRISTLEKKINEAFEKSDIEAAKKFLAQLKYYVTIEQRIRTLELELGVVR